MRTQIGRRGYCAKNIGTADPVGMGRKSCLYTILENSVLDQLYAFGRNILVFHVAVLSITTMVLMMETGCFICDVGCTSLNEIKITIEFMIKQLSWLVWLW